MLDIDYHHGNGTQTIFYERGDVLTVSVHGDPLTEYPFFLATPTSGAGAGEGCNLNLPLAAGTGYAGWREALRAGMRAVQDFRADALVIALGVDTFEGDPISKFRWPAPTTGKSAAIWRPWGCRPSSRWRAVMRWKKSAPTSPTS